MNELGAVILHYRHWPGVRDTIDALLDQGIDPRNVCIVDNASSDGSVQQIRSAYPQCPGIVELPENLGYATGMNAGIRSLRERDILLLTHETVLGAGSLGVLRDHLSTHPETGVVGPLLAFRDNTAIVFSEGGRFNSRMAISHRSAGEALVDHEHDEPREVDWLDGSCLLIRHEVVDTVGFLDERYFLYYEETDYQVRVRKHGWRIECVPAARAMQQPGRRPTALWVRNRLRFLRRNAPLPVFFRQALVDLQTVVRGPERRLTAYGLCGYFLRVDPRSLHHVSQGAIAVGQPPRTARPADS